MDDKTLKKRWLCRWVCSGFVGGFVGGLVGGLVGGHEHTKEIPNEFCWDQSTGVGHPSLYYTLISGAQ